MSVNADTGAPSASSEVTVDRNVRIPTSAPGITLSADLYLPVGAGPCPAVLTVWPYRKDAGFTEAAFRWFAERGYAAVLVDARGTGSSDGTQRPAFDPAEADDAVAAIEWAAAQHWCDGNVGMWGHSYGAILSLRAASRRPMALRAIVPFQAVLDPERDLWHPDGIRGGITLLSWGAATLVHQLLPPLLAHEDGEERRRWHRRLQDTEPWLLDLVRHGPGHPEWRRRVIDVGSISVPTLCVAGWRDLMCEGTVRAFEQIAAPKKLIVGPWTHTIPQDSPVEPIDYFAVVLRWWDHWLRGHDNGVMDEPPVSLYIQGARPGWRGYESWPPAKEELRFAAVSARTLTAVVGDGSTQPNGAGIEYMPDATAGALSGPWWLGNTLLPFDQHDDDLRALPFTSDPLADDLLIAGRPQVNVSVSPSDGGRPPHDRLVVRLADVDPLGRSTFITAGASSAPDIAGESLTVTLWPTAYRVAAGHRVRVVISDADFPRLWPSDRAIPVRVQAVELIVFLMSDDAGMAIEMPPFQPGGTAPSPEQLWGTRNFRITRDHASDAVELVVGEDGAIRTPARGHVLHLRQQVRARLRRDAPGAAVIEADDGATVRLTTGESVDVQVTAELARNGVHLRANVTTDGTTTFTRNWHACAPRQELDSPMNSDTVQPSLDPAVRVEQLLRRYGDPDACVAELLCDQYPADVVAYRVVDRDLNATVVTYGELRERSERFCTALAALGVTAGDRVATLMGKSIDYLTVLLGIWRLGAVHVPLFTAFAPPAIATRLIGSATKVVVCDTTQRPKLEPGTDIPADPPWRVVLASDVSEALQPGDWLLAELLALHEPGMEPAAVGGDAGLIHIYTSGTTGMPKGVVVPVKALASFRVYMEYGLDVRSDDVFWCSADPGWAYGLYYAILGPLTLGVPALLLDAPFSPELTWSVLARYGVTNFAAAPTVYRALRASSTRAPDSVALRRASSAGEPLTPEINEWSTATLGIPVRDHYGQTEAGMLINNHHHPTLRRQLKPGSMGRAMPGWSLHVLAPDADTVVQPGEAGRIAVDMTASPLAWFHGYHDAPDATAAKFSPDRRWYYTGDTGSIDEDGDLVFASRDDDVIIMAGYRIGPFEVESVLATHPAVAECAAIAVPDDIRGEVLEAHVVLAEGHAGTDELVAELQALVKHKLAAHAYPRNVVFADGLPKTPSGKIQRFVLRQQRRVQLAPHSR